MDFFFKVVHVAASNGMNEDEVHEVQGVCDKLIAGVP